VHEYALVVVDVAFEAFARAARLVDGDESNGVGLNLIDIDRDAARARVAFDAIEVLAKSTVFSSVRRREDEGGGRAERGERARHRSDDFN
tara:strand:- start:3798 stop:4067 length:270 start_codon:yes stop_codon:yes gene_type:complete